MNLGSLVNRKHCTICSPKTHIILTDIIIIPSPNASPSQFSSVLISNAIVQTLIWNSKQNFLAVNLYNLKQDAYFQGYTQLQISVWNSRDRKTKKIAGQSKVKKSEQLLRRNPTLPLGFALMWAPSCGSAPGTGLCLGPQLAWNTLWSVGGALQAPVAALWSCTLLSVACLSLLGRQPTAFISVSYDGHPALSGVSSAPPLSQLHFMPPHAGVSTLGGLQSFPLTSLAGRGQP